MTEESVFCFSIHTLSAFCKRNMFWFMLRWCIFVFIEWLDFVSWLFWDFMLSKWSTCWRREKSSLWRLRPTRRKGDRDEPEALTVPGAAACTHSRVLECQCVCDSVSICMCVCVVPMRLATEAGWKCYWSSAPRPATSDWLSTYGNYTNTHTCTLKGVVRI